MGKYIYLGGDIYDTITIGDDFFDPDSAREPPIVARWQPCKENAESVLGLCNSSRISISPNPSNGIFQLRINNYELGNKGVIEIYNMLGQKVKSDELKAKNTDIDISGNPNGIYLYRVIDANGKVIGEGKLVKQ